MNSAATTEQCRETILSRTVIDNWARGLVFKLFSHISFGQIVVLEGDSQHDDEQIFGKDKTLCANLRILHPGFYRKILFGGSVGAGEAYIDKLWEVDDLTAFIRIMALNLEQLSRTEWRFLRFLRPFSLLRHTLRRNSRRGAQRNILAHYDLGNEMYKSFLDSAMMYSSAIYPDKKSSLEEASNHKLMTICNKLDLQPTDRVIEIGTGWGGFAIYAARNYGCHVTTTTISDAQHDEAKKRITEAGLTENITLLRKDYRDLTGRFDKLVSIEMIEAVGNNYLSRFFSKCNELLREDGVMLLQAITIRDQKYKKYINGVDFIQRHIFPGGCLVSNCRMIELLTDQTDMVVRYLADFGFDYARTLKDWRIRFNKTFNQLKTKGYDEKFRRLWEFYLCYCEGGFLERSISVVHLVATRSANRKQLVC